MSQLLQTEVVSHRSETDPFRVLFLTPSAPQELVVEVYWHLAQQCQDEARADPDQRSRLDQLSRAYATISSQLGKRANAAEGPPSAEGMTSTSGTRGWLPWRRKKHVEHVARVRTPWELLRVEPGAPAGVLDLAYDLLKRQLQSRWDDDAAAELASLEEANLVLQQPGTAPRSEAAAQVTAQTPASAVAVPEPALTETAVDEPVPTGAAEATGRAATATKWLLSAVAQGSSLAWRGLLAGSSLAWRGLLAGSKASGRWALRVLRPRWERFVVWLKRRAVDPFNEYRPDAPPKVDTKAQAETHNVTRSELEERLAGLALERDRVTGDPQDAASAQVTEESALTAPVQSEALPESSVIESAGASAHLVAEATTQIVPIGSRPLWIGTHPGCDIVPTVPNTDRKQVMARVWSHGDELMLHVMATEQPTILLNGQPATWSLLEDGDQLQLGAEMFHVRIDPRGNGAEGKQG